MNEKEFNSEVKNKLEIKKDWMDKRREIKSEERIKHHYQIRKLKRCERKRKMQKTGNDQGVYTWSSEKLKTKAIKLKEH